MSPLGCASCFWVAQNPSGADGCGQGSGCSLCPPTCRRSWRWIGAKLQTGRGWVMEDLHFQQDRCLLSFLPSICSHALFWEVVNFKGKTKVTGGCQPSAIRGHCGTSGCSWFRTNGGNVWRRGFLPQGCLNLSGKVFSRRTTYSTLWNLEVKTCLADGQALGSVINSVTGEHLFLSVSGFSSSATLMRHAKGSLPLALGSVGAVFTRLNID